VTGGVVARKVEVRGAGTAKVISPVAAFLLTIVAFGIYYVFWYGIRRWAREAEQLERGRLGAAPRVR
jgi:hypothetical protein